MFNSQTYQRYLKTPHWRKVSQSAKARHPYCTKCGSRKRLETHHRTYVRVGHEQPGDLLVLCHDCHMKHYHPHREKRFRKKSWWRQLLGL